MKPVVVFLSLSKFGKFTFVASYTICFIIVFPLTNGGNEIFGFLVREQKGGNFQRKGGRTTLELLW